MSVNSFWELLEAKQDAVSMGLLDEVLTKCQDLVSTVGSSAFHGAIPDSTVTTALLSVLQDSLPQDTELLATVDHQTLVQELVRAVASRLLQIMKPHAFLLQAYAGVRLPAAYEDFYLHRQEHYNLKQLLSAILSSHALPSLAFQAVGPASPTSQQREQSHTEAEAEAACDEPETSAAAEARAAAGCQAQVLQQSPPQSKWVIFTNTTPDLDYILPAGEPLVTIPLCLCPVTVCLVLYNYDVWLQCTMSCRLLSVQGFGRVILHAFNKTQLLSSPATMLHVTYANPLGLPGCSGRMSEAPEMLKRHTLLQSYVMEHPEVSF